MRSFFIKTTQLVLVFGVFLLSSNNTFAQSPSASASATPSTNQASPSASITEKLNALKAEIASKAALIKQEVNRRIDNKAWLGTIKTINEDSIVITSIDQDRTIRINEYTSYKVKAKGESAIKDLKVGDYVAALGDVDDNNQLNAKRIDKLATTKEYKKKLVWGTVKTVVNDTVTIATSSGQLTTINTANYTDYQLNDTEATLSDIQANRQIIGIVTPNTSEKLMANHILIIAPYGNIKTAVKTASQSATATSSAKPSGTATSSAAKKN